MKSALRSAILTAATACAPSAEETTEPVPPADFSTRAEGDLQTGPAFVELEFGDAKILVLHDGGFSYPPEFVLGDVAQMQEVRTRYGLEGDDATLWLPYLGVAIVEDGVTTLVDAGGNPALFPGAGRLAQSLTLAGIEPADVDHVIVTHAHPDHIGGLSDGDGGATFPEATVWLDPLEVEYWNDPANPAAHPEDAEFYAYVSGVLGLVAGQTESASDETRPSPSVSLHATHGHTPGHRSVRVDVSPPVWIVGDLFILDLFVERPELRPGNIPGEDPEALRAEIHAFCRRAADEGALVIASHLPPFPSVGTISWDGASCRWEPLSP